jgi:N-acylneuraminate cytidylyltransferase
MRVAVIPARGGSKRIPRKNVRPFAGKPMIAYSIECSLASRLFDRVIVSTDDPEIAQVARDFGADVPFMRPAALADDHAGVTEVIAHAIEALQAQGVELTAVCCIYATAPFLRAADLEQGLDALESGAFEYVLAATTFSYPIFRSFGELPGGGLEMVFPDRFETRSQDLPEALHDAAQFCWGRPEAWLARRRVFDRHSTVVRIPRWRVQDIDTEEDWARAEAMAAYLNASVSA